jgi:hypothetical protein
MIRETSFFPRFNNSVAKGVLNKPVSFTKTKESTRKTEEKLDGRNKEGQNERNLKEGHWEDRKQWSLGV